MFMQWRKFPPVPITRQLFKVRSATTEPFKYTLAHSGLNLNGLFSTSAWRFLHEPLFSNLERGETVAVGAGLGKQQQVGDYRINGLNQRALKIAKDVGTRSIYGPGGELIAEIGATNMQYVYLNGQLLGVVRANQFYASHNDQTGRP